MTGESSTPTPYAVRCYHCNEGQLVYLTNEEYERQMSRPDAKWQCPRCHSFASWDDDNYELHLLLREANEGEGKEKSDAQ